MRSYPTGFCVGCGAAPDVISIAPPREVYCRRCAPADPPPRELQDAERCDECRGAMNHYTSDGQPKCAGHWHASIDLPLPALPIEPAPPASNGAAEHGMSPEQAEALATVFDQEPPAAPRTASWIPAPRRAPGPEPAPSTLPAPRPGLIERLTGSPTLPEKKQPAMPEWTPTKPDPRCGLMAWRWTGKSWVCPQCNPELAGDDAGAEQ